MRKMKKLLTGMLTAACLLAVPCSAQAAAKKVWKPTKIQIYTKFKNDSWSKSTTYTRKYNKKGYLVSESEKQFYGTINWKYTYSGNRLKQMVSNIDQYKADTRYTYAVNKKGQITKVTKKLLTTGKVTYISTFSYDSKGNCIKEKYVDKTTGRTHTYTFKYNSKGKLTKAKYTGISHEFSSFDSHGNPRKRDGKTYSYKYDKKGRLVQAVYKPTSNTTYKIVYSGYKKVYDEPGALKVHPMIDTSDMYHW